MAFHAYVFFSNSQCAEAFQYYQQVFGGELRIMRMSDAPQEARMPGVDPDSVMHASLTVADALLMGSDDPTGDGGPKLGFSVSYSAPDADTARRVFEALADGGEVTMPLEETFWSPVFGGCNDRFGTPWMVDVDTAAPSA